MRRGTSSLRAVVALAATVLLVSVLSACSLSGKTAVPAESTGSSDSSSVPTDKRGAVNFDKGFIEFGTGETVVDVYLDPMCPFCGEFDRSSGPGLADSADTNQITLRIHPLTFLDRASQGTKYSTRAASALICVATAQPAHTLSFLSALFADQPEENSTGLTNSELIKRADDTGATGLDSCIDSVAYGRWVQAETTAALNGPIEGADIPRIDGTPKILVNGHPFVGDFRDAAAVEAFITAGGA